MTQAPSARFAAAPAAARPAPRAPSILSVVLFTGFGIVATVLGFVFLPVAGAALALLVGWKGLETHYRFDGPPGARIVSLILFTAFATVATVMGFVFLPIAGLALAAMFLWWGFGAYAETDGSAVGPHVGSPLQPSPNRAFDAYRAATLDRLDQERQAFEGFLDRLREAKDRDEFDHFMTTRAAHHAARETD